MGDRPPTSPVPWRCAAFQLLVCTRFRIVRVQFYLQVQLERRWQAFVTQWQALVRHWASGLCVAYNCQALLCWFWNGSCSLYGGHAWSVGGVGEHRPACYSAPRFSISFLLFNRINVDNSGGNSFQLLPCLVPPRLVQNFALQNRWLSCSYFPVLGGAGPLQLFLCWAGVPSVSGEKGSSWP